MTNDNPSLVCYRMPYSEKYVVFSGMSSLTDACHVEEGSFVVAPFQFTSGLLQIKPLRHLDSDPEVGAFGWHYVPRPFQKSSKAGFISLVENARKEIRAGRLNKVVVSRQAKIQLPRGFNPFDFFKTALQEYANAFVSLVSTPEYGTWIGATPELLLASKSGNYEIHSLAGTFTEYDSLPEGLKDKNRAEQEMVSEYIRKKLSEHQLEFAESGPRLVRAGNVSHLRTTFLAKQNKRENCLELLKALHPTPAVCGFPDDIALDFLLKNEDNPRDLYGGFLGSYTNSEEFDFYVNLRCMKILKEEAILYAGAGIVEASDPETEWIETENKMKTLLSLLTGHA